MTGNADTVLLPPSAMSSGFYARDGGGGHDSNTLLADLHNNSAIWNSGAFNTAAMDRFGYAILNAVEHNGRDNIVETTRQSMATQIAVEKVGAAQALAISNSTAAIQLEASKNNAAALAAIAACCCELKQGQAVTNALIREVESNRIRDELSDAKSELAFLRHFPGTGNGNG